uniref:Uncharacterized protein n=1 Tax=Nelumbo nucifera TaxID=4432 RepID=A0A822YRE0_NELNU|nr:TPA_asm: hypothetical protein HUJ06_012466 [Nelumbo nucifera]
MMSGGYTSLDKDNEKISGSVLAASDPAHVTVKFAESNLQTFPPSQAQGKITGGFQPPRDADGIAAAWLVIDKGGQGIGLVERELGKKLEEERGFGMEERIEWFG